MNVKKKTSKQKEKRLLFELIHKVLILTLYSYPRVLQMCMFTFCSLPEVLFSPNAARLLTAYSTFALFLAMFRELFSFR